MAVAANGKRRGTRLKLRLWADDGGFTTVGMTVALWVTLALVLMGAQVYRLQSAAAEVQDVADAAALAAENEVAEFMVVVRVCDAVCLTLSLASLTASALGTVALCVPPAAPIGERLLQSAHNLAQARNSFARSAQKGLNALQTALPFICAAQAASVAAQNNGGYAQSNYVALALLVNSTGKTIDVAEEQTSEDVAADAQDKAADLEAQAQQAEEAAAAANEAKTTGFMADCGNNPGYCMYQRAATLANLTDAENPLYSSADAWSFSVALQRAQAYYQARLDQEQPDSDSVADGARSALRALFYQYAADQMQLGYVWEGDGFQAYFPTLPKNTDQMRQTSLYTQAVFPVTEDDQGKCLHAWEGCPNAAGSSTCGSLADMEAEDYQTCSLCKLTAESMGNVAAASTSVENGFEYHYARVAKAASDYQQALEDAQPASSQAKQDADDVFEKVKAALGEVAAHRIDATPPGSYGCIALVVNRASSTSVGFTSSLVSGSTTLGTCAAISGATLIEEQGDQGATIITSLLDGLGLTGAVADAWGLGSGAWSTLLTVYAQGQSGLLDAVEQALSSIPLASASGLGSWARRQLEAVIDDAGLTPVRLNALKPVLVNSEHVAESTSTAFTTSFATAKTLATQNSAAAGRVFDLGMDAVVRGITDGKVKLKDGQLVATVKPFGDASSVSIPITIALPDFVENGGESLVQQAIDWVGSTVASSSQVTPWE